VTPSVGGPGCKTTAASSASRDQLADQHQCDQTGGVVGAATNRQRAGEGDQLAELDTSARPLGRPAARRQLGGGRRGERER
jgi:hypothetical protein